MAIWHVVSINATSTLILPLPCIACGAVGTPEYKVTAVQIEAIDGAAVAG